jgi:GTPase SAR1 family protein
MPHNQNNSGIISNPTRLVMTVGDARVGKSTIARLLIEIYLESKLNLRVYYSGNRNKLYAYQLLLPIAQLPLTQGGADQLLIDLETFSDVQVALSDLPGQNFEEFRQFAQEVMLWDAIAQLGYRITFVHPISYRRDCTEYLQELFNCYGDKADYIIIKNLYFGDEFLYYDGSDIQQHIEASGGDELYLGKLWRDSYELVESLDSPYSYAVQNYELDFMNRSRVFNWMEEFSEQISNNKHIEKLLGFSNITSSLDLENKLTSDF